MNTCNKSSKNSTTIQKYNGRYNIIACSANKTVEKNNFPLLNSMVIIFLKSYTVIKKIIKYPIKVVNAAAIIPNFGIKIKFRTIFDAHPATVTFKFPRVFLETI